MKKIVAVVCMLVFLALNVTACSAKANKFEIWNGLQFGDTMEEVAKKCDSQDLKCHSYSDSE